MAEVKIHDRQGQTLTVWFTDPSLEHGAEEIGDVLMRDPEGSNLDEALTLDAALSA